MKLESSSDLVFIAWNSLPNTNAIFCCRFWAAIDGKLFGDSGNRHSASGATSYWSFQLDQADGPIYIRYAKP
jgi:hypothetical protein